MKLRDITDVDSNAEVTGFAIDHRKVAKGSVFGAFRGAVFNGEDFIEQAVDRVVQRVLEVFGHRILLRRDHRIELLDGLVALEGDLGGCLLERRDALR